MFLKALDDSNKNVAWPVIELYGIGSILVKLLVIVFIISSRCPWSHFCTTDDLSVMSALQAVVGRNIAATDAAICSVDDRNEVFNQIYAGSL